MTKAGQMESKGYSKILRERRSLFFKVYFVKIKTLNFFILNHKKRGYTESLKIIEN